MGNVVDGSNRSTGCRVDNIDTRQGISDDILFALDILDAKVVLA